MFWWIIGFSAAIEVEYKTNMSLSEFLKDLPTHNRDNFTRLQTDSNLGRPTHGQVIRFVKLLCPSISTMDNTLSLTQAYIHCHYLFRWRRVHVLLYMFPQKIFHQNKWLSQKRQIYYLGISINNGIKRRPRRQMLNEREKRKVIKMTYNVDFALT